MAKVQATYTAPPDDSKMCDIGGKTFFDGKETELDSEEDAALIATLKANKHFELSGAEEPDDDDKSDEGETKPSPAPSGTGRASGGNYGKPDNSPRE